MYTKYTLIAQHPSKSGTHEILMSFKLVTNQVYSKLMIQRGFSNKFWVL